MTPEVKTTRYFTCPNGCAYKFTVEHLFTDMQDRQAGPWYCEECGQAWNPCVRAGVLHVEPARQSKRDRWVILELIPPAQPLRFKVKGARYFRDGKHEGSDDSTRYLYEEHTCPTNWMKEVTEVYLGDESDPHGLCRVVAEYDHDVDAGGTPVLEEHEPAVLLPPAT